MTDEKLELLFDKLENKFDGHMTAFYNKFEEHTKEDAKTFKEINDTLVSTKGWIRGAVAVIMVLGTGLMFLSNFVHDFVRQWFG